MSYTAYQFLDTCFLLQSDEPAFLTSFEKAYKRFQIPIKDNLPIYKITFLGQVPELNLDGQIFTAQNKKDLEFYAYNAILNAATLRVRSHILFHAASLCSPDGHGVLFSGRSGLGKTTLTIALLKRGFHFLSDDVSAIGREDRLIYPFPRGLGITIPGPLPNQKQFVDIDEVQQNSLGQPSPARYLFILSEPNDTPSPLHSGSNSQSTEVYFVTTDRHETAWLESVKAIPGVRAANVIRSSQYRALRIEIERRLLPEIEPKIESLCLRDNILLFAISRGETVRRTDHTRDASLEQLSAHEAALDLAANFKGGPKSDLLLQEYGGSPTRFFMALVALTTKMRCFRLTVGKLDQMVNLVLQNVEAT